MHSLTGPRGLWRTPADSDPCASWHPRILGHSIAGNQPPHPGKLDSHGGGGTSKEDTLKDHSWVLGGGPPEKVTLGRSSKVLPQYWEIWTSGSLPPFLWDRPSGLLTGKRSSSMTKRIVRFRSLCKFPQFVVIVLACLFSPIIYSLCPKSKRNSHWYQHNYSFALPYNVTSENITRFIFLQFILSSCGCMTQRMCFQIVLFKITFDSSFLYGSVNQQDV